MYTAIGYAAQSATTPLAPMSFQRRSPRADDVAIEILYCGVCHSDIHQARNEWGIAVYPLTVSYTHLTLPTIYSV